MTNSHNTGWLASWKKLVTIVVAGAAAVLAYNYGEVKGSVSDAWYDVRWLAGYPDYGVTVTGTPPEQGRIRFDFNVTTSKETIESANCVCEWEALKTANTDMNVWNNQFVSRKRIFNVRPGDAPADITCGVSLPQVIVTFARVVVDIEMKLAERTGTHVYRPTFELRKDRVGLPVWVMVESWSGKPEDRPKTPTNTGTGTAPPK
jgi:hypothetical protein